MLINSNHTKGRQHFTIAHELFHLFIEETPEPHKCTDNNQQNAIEQKADMFASVLLMPEDGIQQLLPPSEYGENKVSLASVLRIEHYYSVSRQALLNRLLGLKYINKSVKEELSNIPAASSAQQYGYDTSLYFPGNKNLIIGNFGEKARILFDKGKISEGHYIELLNKLNYDDDKQN
jgi:Zn-dependent peptidase ImmA (M78 family)